MRGNLLKISTEVSELSSLGAFTVSAGSASTALTVPGLSVRRAETTVEIPSGGSLVLVAPHDPKPLLAQIAEREQADDFEPSEPQLWAPRPVLEHWKKLRRQQAEEALSAATKAQ